MEVNIELVLSLAKERQKINSVPLRNVVWFKAGEPLIIRDKTIERFELTGLSNVDFITSEYYKIV